MRQSRLCERSYNNRPKIAALLRLPPAPQSHLNIQFRATVMTTSMLALVRVHLQGLSRVSILTTSASALWFVSIDVAPTALQEVRLYCPCDQSFYEKVTGQSFFAPSSPPPAS